MTWLVKLVSRNDEELRDRNCLGGGRGIDIYKLPIRATFTVEAKSCRMAEKAAMAESGPRGVSNAICSYVELVDRSES